MECNHLSMSLLHIDGLVQDCSNFSALAIELLQSCTKPSICNLATEALMLGYE